MFRADAFATNNIMHRAGCDIGDNDNACVFFLLHNVHWGELRREIVFVDWSAHSGIYLYNGLKW